MPPPEFNALFRVQLAQLLEWRRDVRHFRNEAVDPELVQRLLESAMLAPSVGYSQPWRWVLVEDPASRAAVLENHGKVNDSAASAYHDERAVQYRNLKLSGLREAPVHLAVFADCGTNTGHGLGRQTMPETALWSVVMAVYALWLAAAAEGLGVGWVSILDPEQVKSMLAIDEQWTFVAYLCLGWPAEYTDKPLLEQTGWESRLKFEDVVFHR